MTQTDEQVIEQLWARLESFEPSEWMYEGEKMFKGRSYSVVLGGEELDTCRAYISHSFRGVTTTSDEVYKLWVTKRLDELFCFQERNPEEDSRLVRIYRHVDECWDPLIPELEEKQEERKLGTLARILKNKDK